MQNIELKIEGMTCNGCAKSVQRALSAVEGVAQAEVDFAAGVAQVRFDSTKTSAQALIVAVEDAGFDAALS